MNTRMILEDARAAEETKAILKKSETSADKEIVLVGDKKLIDAAQNRKYKLPGLQQAQAQKLQAYRDKYDKFLKMHNNTSQKEVWKIYDHIAAELMKEQLNKAIQEVVTGDMDRFVEQVIMDEFS